MPSLQQPLGEAQPPGLVEADEARAAALGVGLEGGRTEGVFEGGAAGVLVGVGDGVYVGEGV